MHKLFYCELIAYKLTHFLNQNHLAVRKFVKKVYGKRKVVGVSPTLVVVIFFSEIENASAMSLTPMP